MNRERARRQEVLRLRAEGRQAYLEGKHIQTVPQKYLGTANRSQWERGYAEARDADLPAACPYCGSPTQTDPSDQFPPPDYCDHA